MDPGTCLDFTHPVRLCADLLPSEPRVAELPPSELGDTKLRQSCRFWNAHDQFQRRSLHHCLQTLTFLRLSPYPTPHDSLPLSLEPNSFLRLGLKLASCLSPSLKHLSSLRLALRRRALRLIREHPSNETTGSQPRGGRWSRGRHFIAEGRHSVEGAAAGCGGGTFPGVALWIA